MLWCGGSTIEPFIRIFWTKQSLVTASCGEINLVEENSNFLVDFFLDPVQCTASALGLA